MKTIYYIYYGKYNRKFSFSKHLVKGFHFFKLSKKKFFTLDKMPNSSDRVSANFKFNETKNLLNQLKQRKKNTQTKNSGTIIYKDAEGNETDLADMFGSLSILEDYIIAYDNVVNEKIRNLVECIAEVLSELYNNNNDVNTSLSKLKTKM